MVDQAKSGHQPGKDLLHEEDVNYGAITSPDQA
jgi:hypothetical protein